MASLRTKKLRKKSNDRELETESASSEAWKRAGQLVVLMFLVAVLSRLSYLGLRAFHHDESLDAWFSLQYLDGTFKGYDPVYHGPLRFYITAAFFWLFGQSDSIARLLPAVSGIAVVLLPWVWRRNLGIIGTPVTIALLLTSPTMLYFSRFGREDSFFLLLTFLTVIAFISFLTKPRSWHPVALLVLLVLSLAVKESVFLTVFIFGSFGIITIGQDFLLAPVGQPQGSVRKPRYKTLNREIRIEGIARRTITVRSRVSHNTNEGLVSEEIIRRWFFIAGIGLMAAAFLWIGTNPGQQENAPTVIKLGIYGATLACAALVCGFIAIRRGAHLPQLPALRAFSTPRLGGWILGIAVAAIVFVALFTQFFQQFDGPGAVTAPYGAIRNGLVSGFEYWLGEQATVRGDSRWQYYLVLLLAYEWVILGLALVGLVSVIRKPNFFGQVIAWWACGSLIVYSWAGERMPWLLVHILLPIVILAGLGGQSVWDRRKRRGATICFGLFLIFGFVYASTTSIYSSYFRGGEPQELFVQAGQATPEVVEWAEQLEILDRISVAHFGRHLEVKIDSDVYWPYGWYLRDFHSSSYAVIENGSFPFGSDVIFVPHWDRMTSNDDDGTYIEIPYEHRWWWVPEFDTGISASNQFGDFISAWADWIWNREPWDSGSDRCPASLSGSVYIRSEIYELGERYFEPPFPRRGEKPEYEKSCQKVSNFLVSNGY